MSRRTPLVPASYTPVSYDRHREQVAADLLDRMRAERLTSYAAAARYGDRPDFWCDAVKGNAALHGLDRELRAAEAMGIRYELVRAGAA